GTPAAALLLGDTDFSPAKRVVEGTRACLRLPPRLLGTTKLDGSSMVVRRLAPQEDKLDPKEITKETIEHIASYCGELLGRAHRHGACKLPSRPWTASDREQIVESSAKLAAFHEAAWIAYFALLG